jgi:hypothetical protein
MAYRNAASVLPLPVGAMSSVCSPAGDPLPAQPLDLGRPRERRLEPAARCIGEVMHCRISAGGCRGWSVGRRCAPRDAARDRQPDQGQRRAELVQVVKDITTHASPTTVIAPEDHAARLYHSHRISGIAAHVRSGMRTIDENHITQTHPVALIARSAHHGRRPCTVSTRPVTIVVGIARDDRRHNRGRPRHTAVGPACRLPVPLRLPEPVRGPFIDPRPNANRRSRSPLK